MLSFLLIQGILLILIILLLYLLSWFWPPDSPWAPWWSTDRKTALIMCKMAKVKKNDIIYDLGCGEGTALITAAKEYGSKGVGVEIDPWRAWYARSLVNLFGLQDKITIIRQDLFKQCIEEASVVFIYLVPKAIQRLKRKILSELKPGTRVICYRYKIPYLNLISEDKERVVYVYEIPKRAKTKSRIK